VVTETAACRRPPDCQLNASKFILLAGLFAIITAEFSFAQNTPTPTVKVEPDPIKSFKELVTRFPTGSVVKLSKSGDYSEIKDVTFDVKKTDSLMNPVIGIINWTEEITTTYTLPVIPGNPDQSKKVRSHRLQLHIQMVFDWQGDHWKFERILNRENGVDFTHGYLTGTGPISDFLKSVQ
jgi:hypothetical protein